MTSQYHSLRFLRRAISKAVPKGEDILTAITTFPRLKYVIAVADT